jgi:hypothetical protein
MLQVNKQHIIIYCFIFVTKQQIDSTIKVYMYCIPLGLFTYKKRDKHTFLWCLFPQHLQHEHMHNYSKNGKKHNV